MRISIDEINTSMSLLETEADGNAWARGFQRGINGGDLKDGASSAYRSGWDVGFAARDQAEKLRETYSGNGALGGRPAKPIGIPIGIPIGEPIGGAIGIPMGEPERPNDLTKNEEQENSPPSPTAIPPKGRVRSAFVPPTESEWVAYCSEQWPEWNPISSAESWAYYNGVANWRTRAGKITDWKSAARTGHGKARDWGTLQPKFATSHQHAAPSARKMHRWAFDKEMSALQAEYNDARGYWRNYPEGSPEQIKFGKLKDAAQAKIDELRKVEII